MDLHHVYWFMVCYIVLGVMHILGRGSVTVWKEEVDCFNTSIVFRESSEERGMESRGRV